LYDCRWNLSHLASFTPQSFTLIFSSSREVSPRLHEKTQPFDTLGLLQPHTVDLLETLLDKKSDMLLTQPVFIDSDLKTLKDDVSQLLLGRWS